jgi:hypothetical protein
MAFMPYLQPMAMKSRDWVRKRTPLNSFFPELLKIYLSRDIKSVRERYGQILCMLFRYQSNVIKTLPGLVYNFLIFPGQQLLYQLTN